jgi:hypothetical protein
MKKIPLKTEEEAKDYAIKWQKWVSEQNLSYMELVHWQEYWNAIGHNFNLLEEFKENGII